MAMRAHHTHALDQERPQLELSGPALKAALEKMIRACESSGGVERYVDALKLKTQIFKNAFGQGNIAELDVDDFIRIASLMPTVRRRIGPHLDDPQKYKALLKALECLFTDDSADVKIAALCAAYPDDKYHRWVRDLGAEILHNINIELYPMMTRWVWDRKANAGVLREIWYGQIDHITLDIEDRFETFLMLREELSQFLTDNGMFQDILYYVDMLNASVYGDYIAAQGGSYLKADFSAEIDPAQHLRRLLGLDGGRTKTNRKLPTAIDGNAELVGQANLLTGDKH